MSNSRSTWPQIGTANYLASNLVGWLHSCSSLAPSCSVKSTPCQSPKSTQSLWPE